MDSIKQNVYVKTNELEMGHIRNIWAINEVPYHNNFSEVTLIFEEAEKKIEITESEFDEFLDRWISICGYPNEVKAKKKELGF